MSVDQTGNEKRAFEINDLTGLVGSEPNDAAAVPRHARRMNFAAEAVYELCVAEEQFRRRLTAGDTEFVAGLSHRRTPSAVACSGVASADDGALRRPEIALKIASAVAGEASGTW